MSELKLWVFAWDLKHVHTLSVLLTRWALKLLTWLALRQIC